MRRNRIGRERILAAFAVALVLGSAGRGDAQSAYRMEVFGSVGRAVSILTDPGLNLGGGVGYRPFSSDRSPFLRMVGVEFETNVSRIPASPGTVSVGAKIFLSPHVSLRPEVRAFAADQASGLRLSAGVGLYW